LRKVVPKPEISPTVTFHTCSDSVTLSYVVWVLHC